MTRWQKRSKLAASCINYDASCINYVIVCSINEDSILAGCLRSLAYTERVCWFSFTLKGACKMSSEATAKEVLYKPVDIGEEDTPRKR